MEIRFYNKEIRKFILSFDEPLSTRISQSITLLKQYHHQLKMPYSKMVERNLFELRITGQPQIRIMYTFSDGVIVLLNGFYKKSEKLPLHELRKARERLKTLEGI